jgi:hypothetical protein
MVDQQGAANENKQGESRMNERVRLKNAIQRLKAIRDSSQSLADRNALDVAIEHVESRLLDGGFRENDAQNAT